MVFYDPCAAGDPGEMRDPLLKSSFSPEGLASPDGKARDSLLRGHMSQCFYSLANLLVQTAYMPFAKSRRHHFYLRDARRVLVIAVGNGIGNSVLLTPLLRSLRAQCPEAVIAALCNSEGVRTVLAPFVNTIINASNQDLASTPRAVRFFRREIAPRQSDLVITPFPVSRPKCSFWCMFSGAKYKVSYMPESMSFTDTFRLSPLHSAHEVEQHVSLLRRLGCDDALIDLMPSFVTGSENEDFASQFLSAHGLDDCKLLMGVHPGASPNQRAKCWPVSRFIEVADAFVERSHGAVIFFGGRDDSNVLQQIEDACSGHHLIAGSQSLADTAALIGRCRLFLSNDSGLMHIAAAMSVPVVAIFGPTSPVKNGPYGVVHRIVTANTPCSPCYTGPPITCPRDWECTRSVTVGMVLDALSAILEDVCRKPVRNARYVDRPGIA